MSISEAVAQVKTAADANDHQLANSLMKNLNWMTLSRDERRILNDIVMDAEAHARAAREFQERRAGNAIELWFHLQLWNISGIVLVALARPHSTRP